MKYFAKIAAVIAVSILGIGSLPVLGDEEQYFDVPGIVLDEVSEAEAAALEKEFGPLESNAAIDSPILTNLLYKPTPNMSPKGYGDAASDGLLHQTHGSGCHARNCILRCPRCRVRKGAKFGHCKTPDRYFNCHARPPRS